MSATPIYQSMTEPISLDLDSPRARRSDPPASHIAADKSQRGLSKLRLGILRMLENEGQMYGTYANFLYREEYMNADGFPRCAPDSVRKRLGEMADPKKGPCYVDVVAHNHGTLEAVYAISPEGRAELERSRS